MKFTNTILIDDDPILRFSVKKIIKEYLGNEHFMSFASGYDALDYLNTFTCVDGTCKILVLLDLHMPVLTGTEFLKLFEKQLMKKKYTISIHVLSTTTSAKEKKAVLRNRLVDGFISKPVTTEELRVLLNS